MHSTWKQHINWHDHQTVACLNEGGTNNISCDG